MKRKRRSDAFSRRTNRPSNEQEGEQVNWWSNLIGALFTFAAEWNQGGGVRSIYKGRKWRRNAKSSSYRYTVTSGKVSR